MGFNMNILNIGGGFGSTNTELEKVSMFYGF